MSGVKSFATGLGHSLKNADMPGEENLSDGMLKHQIGSEEELEELRIMQELGGDHLKQICESETWQMACLRARKYDHARAIILVEKYMQWRAESEYDTAERLKDSEFVAHLKTGMVRTPGLTDRAGRGLVIVDLSRHDPSRWTAKQTVEMVHCQLESLLLSSPELQVRGITVINDLSNVHLSNLDHHIPKELFSAFSSKFPMRLGGIFLLHPPFFFKMVWPVVRMFMKKKFLERVHTLDSYDKLGEWIVPEQLLVDQGGTVTYDHEKAVDDLIQKVCN